MKLAKYLADHMNFVVNNYIANNDYEHEVKRVLQIIRLSGKIKKSDLTRKTQNLQSYARSDILETLKESEQILEYKLGKGNTETVWYVAKNENIIEEI